MSGDFEEYGACECAYGLHLAAILLNGLRDYGTAQWDGGDSGCDHVERSTRGDAGRPATLVARGVGGALIPSGSSLPVDTPIRYRDICGKCGARRIDRQLGLEATPDEYVATMVEVFREVRRVLRDDGTLWLNMGDSYASAPVGSFNGGGFKDKSAQTGGRDMSGVATSGIVDKVRASGLASKQLLGMPWRLAFALQADGWWLRSDIIWCLSGGTRVYAKTQKGEMPMTIKDMVRLDPATVQLWNGEKWTQVLGWNRVERPETTYEVELRTGQRIGCTADHKWPTQRGLVRTDQLHANGGLFPADVIQTCRLPEPTNPRQPAALDDDITGWFVGLYIAEGSQSDGTIQIASHLKEGERFARLDQIALALHGTARLHKTSENGCTINLNGPMLKGLVDTYVSGRVANDKHLHPRCWQRSDMFLRAVLRGYLSGDGHWNEASQRWRLGFCANDELVADLRALAARLGVSLHLRRCVHKLGDREFSGYKGDLRLEQSPPRRMPDGQVVAVRESRAREFWHIGVEDEPHLFSLSSGVLTSNSKPNPMPESVTDRPTGAYEHVFLLSKRATYFYDSAAIAEPAIRAGDIPGGSNGFISHITGGHNKDGLAANGQRPVAAMRSCRNVWTIATQAFSESHFATMPTALVEKCVRAGTSERGCCAACGAPWGRVVERSVLWHQRTGTNGNTDRNDGGMSCNADRSITTTGWQPSCICAAATRPCTVLDPFAGAGTVGLVADRLQRDAVQIELNGAYVAMMRARIVADAPLLAEVAD